MINDELIKTNTIKMLNKRPMRDMTKTIKLIAVSLALVFSHFLFYWFGSRSSDNILQLNFKLIQWLNAEVEYWQPRFEVWIDTPNNKKGG